MIVCPQCENPLAERDASFDCERCGYKAQKESGAVIFDAKLEVGFPDYDPEALDVFRRYENNHFWFKSRKDMIRDAFARFVKKEDKVIEIGAGNGYISEMLLQKGYDVAVGDVHRRSFNRLGGNNIVEKYQFDVTETPFREHFDVVGMFDVLEHIGEDELAIRKIRVMLKNGGRAIVTVPAHQWLWSKYDRTHKRRYELKELKKKFESNGFTVAMAKNFFVFITPLLLIRSVLNKNMKKGESVAIAQEQIKINPLANKILYFMTKAENKMLKKFSPHIGGSIMLVAIKNDNYDSF